MLKLVFSFLLVFPALAFDFANYKVSVQTTDGMLTITDKLTNEKTIFQNIADADEIRNYNSKGVLTHLYQKANSGFSSLDYTTNNGFKLIHLTIHSYELQKLKRVKNKWTVIASQVTDTQLVSQNEHSRQIDYYHPCNHKITDDQLNSLLNFGQDILNIHLGGTIANKWIPGSDNVEVNEACIDGFKNISSAHQKIIQALNTGVNKGLHCMQERAEYALSIEDDAIKKRGETLRTMMRMIIGNFVNNAKSPFRIDCAHEGFFQEFATNSSNLAQAKICDHELIDVKHKISPGILINTAAINRVGFENIDLPKVLFHEMLHHTGFLHTNADRRDKFDLVYQLSSCCFDERVSPGDLGSDSCNRIITHDHMDPIIMQRTRTGKTVN